ncbi:MAG: portal protein, partial [bacterium]
LGSGYPFGEDILMMLHAEIDDVFMVPLFRMLDRLERQVTATEIAERQGERVSSLSGPLTRQNAEGTGPMVMRTFNIMARQGMMPPPPPILMKTGAPMDVEFTGLLSQAQRRYHQSQSLNAGLNTIGGLVNISQNPGILDNIDLDDLVRKIAETEGFPASAVRELPEIKKMRAIRAKQLERQQQMQGAQARADVLNKTSKAPEEGSPAEGILQGSGLV